MTQPITTIVIAEQGPAGPQGLHPQASWNAQGVPYVRDTVLSHNGALWLALRSNSVEPSLSVPEDWAQWIANVATLGPDGKLPVGQLPAIAITDTSEVGSEAAMLSLTAQTGDVAIRSDLNKSFVLAAEPASTLANWKELKTPTDAVLSVAGRTGAVTLAQADVAGLTSSSSPAFAGVQVKSTGGPGVSVTSGTGASDVGISVTRSNGARAGIDIHNPTAGNGGQHMLRIHNDAADGVTYPKVPTYVNSRGAYYSQSWMVISGSWSGVTADTTVINSPTADPAMLGIWSDVGGPGIQVRAANAAGAYNFCGLDRNANYTFSVEENGALKWGASTRASMTTSLSLTPGGGLTLAAPANGFSIGNSLAVRAAAVSGTYYNMLQVDASDKLTIGSPSLPSHVQAMVPATKEWRFLTSTAGRLVTIYEASQTMAVGPVDDTGAAITAKASADAKKGIVSRAFSATQAANLFEAQDSTGAVKSGMNKAGYIFTVLNAAPADADLSANQAMIWFDSTNGAAKLMIKGKTAGGTVVSGSVPLS